MSNLEQLTTWKEMWNDVQKLKEHEDLNKRYHKLITKIEKNKEIDDEIDGNEFFLILRIHYRRDIDKKCQFISNKVKNRFFKGQLFAEDCRKIQKIKEESDNDLNPDEFRELFFDLVEIDKIVDEKIYAEKYSIKIAILFLIIGFILGIVGSYVLKIWGV